MVEAVKNFIQVIYIIFLEHYKDQTELFLAGKYLLMDAWNRTNLVY
jgi:hypothetical protein